jgi:hydrogenase-4 component E
MAFQGVVVASCPLFIGHEMSAGGVVFTIVTLADPGDRHSRCASTWPSKKSPSPRGGAHCRLPCLLLAGLLLIVGGHLCQPKFNVPYSSVSALLLPTAITLLVAGMFLLMARRNAIAMVLGYIMMENGIYLVGTSFSMRARHIVEFGILLDVLAGVMIMAVILQNIKQTFDDVDTARSEH